MEHFEKGQVYNYNEIETILNDALEYVIEALKEKRNEYINDEMGKLMFELHTNMILTLYKAAVLKRS